MSHTFVRTTTLLLVIGGGLAGCASMDHQERDAVLTTVQSLFNAMEAKDADAARRLVVPGGALVDVRDDPNDPESNRVRARSNAEFVRSLSEIEPPILERMWDPTVKIEGDIAMVWTSYDFWIDNEFSHCGVDAFSLVRTDDGWKIATITYSARTEGCEESPLGPPRGGRRVLDTTSRNAR